MWCRQLSLFSYCVYVYEVFVFKMESEPRIVANVLLTSGPTLHLPYEAHAVNRQHTRATWHRPKPYRCGRSGSSLVPKIEQAVTMLLTPQEPKCFSQTADDVHRTGMWWWRGGVHSSYGEWAVDYRPTYVRTTRRGVFGVDLAFPEELSQLVPFMPASCLTTHSQKMMMKKE